MPHQLAEMACPGRRDDLYAGKLVIEIQGQRSRQGMTFHKRADEGAVRDIHQEGTDDDAAQHFILMKQGESDMIHV